MRSDAKFDNFSVLLQQNIVKAHCSGLNIVSQKDMSKASPLPSPYECDLARHSFCKDVVELRNGGSLFLNGLQ